MGFHGRAARQNHAWTTTAKPAPVDNTPQHLPGSNAAFTLTQLADRHHTPDWRPEGHPPMPDVVANGGGPKVFACGYCHLPNGQGRPENAPLAAQPAAYLVQQLQEMSAGRRHSSQPKMGPPALMLDIARNITPQDLQTAADYFAKLTYRPWIRVVETATVPKTKVDSHSMLAPIPGGGTEALGMRIVETAEDLHRTELRDAASGFVDYVPPGSIARGESLVRTGGGAQPCRSCHGPALKGMTGTPALAGRSPAYLVRQLFDMQYRARSGPAVLQMLPEVAHMTDEKRIDVAAYLGSLKP